MNKNSLIYGILGTFAIAGLTYAITYNYYKKDIEFAENNKELIKVIDDVKENFYKDVNEEDMTYNMISGLINGLDDRYTYYYNSDMSSEKYVNDSITLKSSGFQIDKDKTENIIITDVQPDSQAEKMNLRKNDIITAVNGVKVTDAGYYNIIPELMGKDGTSMKLDILRDGESFEINFIRSNFLEKYSAYEHRMIDEDTLYFRFNGFDESTIENFNYAVEENKNIKNVIFDLRNNSGGMTKECVKFFDLFAGEGNQVKESYSKSGKEFLYQTTSDVKYNFNVVLLVSKNTYSSGEIFSSLFQDSGLGTVIGTQTAGKGVFQRSTMLDNFTSYAIVSGYYYVNDIPNFHNVGITPDIVIDMDKDLINTDNDIQLQKAIEFLEK